VTRFATAVAVAALLAAATGCGKSDDKAGNASAGSAVPGPAAPAEAPSAVAASAELGRMLYEQKGCAACHSIDGSPRVGPSFLGAASRATTTTRFTDGTFARDLIGEGKKFPAVRDYIKASFLEPLDHIVDGFPPSAPSYKNVLKPHESESLALFVESLGQP
jgi:cytochrome c oxidase subunit 2